MEAALLTGFGSCVCSLQGNDPSVPPVWPELTHFPHEVTFSCFRFYRMLYLVLLLPYEHAVFPGLPDPAHYLLRLVLKRRDVTQLKTLQSE